MSDDSDHDRPPRAENAKDPAHAVRAGNILGRAWRNDGPRGPWFSFRIDRVYLDKETGTEKTAVSLGVNDLLPAAEVLRSLWALAAAGDA